MGLKGQWPPKLKAFVERAFDRCTEDAERVAMEGELKKVITNAIQEGSLWQIDWDKEVLPKKEKETHQPQKKNQNQNSKKKKNKKSETLPGMIKEEDEEKKQRRQKRFLSSAVTSRSAVSAIVLDGAEVDWDEMTVKGLSQELEKPYLRLTSAPDPATVRPEPVLKKAIKMLREKWQQSEDYGYICEQLKSVRQDLTVQRIKNAFTVGVYEMHARLALENDDMGEFNQCQTQLKELYREGLGTAHVAEFTSYRILYYLHLQGDAANVLADVSHVLRQEAPVVHAIQVMTALAINNYHKFFKLYPETPNMGQYLMDKLVKRMRTTAIKVIIKSYRPSISVSFVQKELGFSKERECTDFLREIGASLVNNGEGLEVDVKSSLV